MSGSIRSRMTASGFSERASCTPSRPLPATTTRNPSNSSESLSPRAMCGSSSTTRIVFFGDTVKSLLLRRGCRRTLAARLDALKVDARPGSRVADLGECDPERAQPLLLPGTGALDVTEARTRVFVAGLVFGEAGELIDFANRPASDRAG